MSDLNFRLAKETDASALLDIYRWYVENSTVTFEYGSPSLAEFSSRIREISRQDPYLLLEEGGQILGYAYSHPHHSRAAYQWNVEFSVYLRQDNRGRGLGWLLYRALEEISRARGMFNLYALVTSPNPASEKLHQRFGFIQEGRLKKAGFKMGRWLDVTWFSKRLPNAPDKPKPPLAFKKLDQALVDKIFQELLKGYSSQGLAKQ